MSLAFGSFSYGSEARSAVKGARDAAVKLKPSILKKSKFLAQPSVSDVFRDSMEVVQFEDGAGGVYSTVTSKLETELNRTGASDFNDSSKGSRRVRFADGRKVTYQLEAVLLDEGIQKKFHMSRQMLARAKSVAVDDAVEASRVLQKHIRTFADYNLAVVSPGNYGYTWKTARESLKTYASKFPIVSLNTEALFCGDRIFIYSAQPGEQWRVSGSERVAWLVRLVHRIVTATSPEEANFYLNKELALLDICVVVGLEALSPNFKHHASSHVDLAEGKALTKISAMTTNQTLKLTALCSKNLALVSVDSTPCATAVRVSNRHVLTCEHVLSGGEELKFASSIVHERFSLAEDLIVARSSAAYEPWHLRDPRKGELVLICYKRFDDVDFAGPYQICDFTVSTINFSKDAEIKPGMSGGAIVALSDLALLGLHSGISDYSGVGLRFSVDLSARMWSADDTLSEVDTVHVNACEPLALMRARGLNSNCRLCAASLSPVVAEGVHVGNALSVKLGLCVVPRLVKGELLSLPVVKVGLGQDEVGGVEYVEAPGLDSVLPQAFRQPVYGEHVLLMGKGVTGQPYVTNTDIKVSQTYDSTGFQVIGIDYQNSELLLGCAVLAVNDGAVLGIVVSPTPTDTEVDKTTAECFFVNGEIDDSLIKPMRELSKAFPNLNVSAWFSQASNEMLQIGGETLDEIYEYSRDLLAMSKVRKSLYSKRRRSARLALEDPKFWDDVVLGRAVQNVDLSKGLLSLRRIWNIEGDEEGVVYSKILLLLIYFVDKYEQSRKIVEIVEHLALI